MKVVTVVGARPQFIKAAPMSRALRRQHTEVLVHTGQHYDYGMSQVFLDELDMPEPDVNLGIGSGSHGRQTGEMLIGLEQVLTAQRPEWVLVYGDTNSTLASALAAAKLGIPIAHIEAGLRSFNRAMPEEHNRVLADHCSDLLFCPTQTSVDNLGREGITRGVHRVGDVMYDAALEHGATARQRSTILDQLRLTPRGYALATIHRPYNTDDPSRLQEILAALGSLDLPVVFPIHPRARDRLGLLGNPQSAIRNLKSADPLGYLDMLALEQAAALILTDSGGVQKEAYFFGVPCVTLRPETEWVETVAAGWNRLAWGDTAVILNAARGPWPSEPPPPIFGDGHTAERIVGILSASHRSPDHL
jgi:UDP-N-acetylglucosamine 2-epimerase